MSYVSYVLLVFPADEKIIFIGGLIGLAQTLKYDQPVTQPYKMMLHK